MAGIYSQGGSAGHRYAGWLSEVEAKNFQFGGKVFNGSPSAIFVGSKMVWPSSWLTFAAVQAIVGAFGQRDGKAVINATNAYLNQLAASDRDKATALAGFINEYPLYAATVNSIYMAVDNIECTGTQYIDTNITAGVYDVEMDVIVTGHTSRDGYSVCFLSTTNQSTKVGYFYWASAYRFAVPGSYAKTFSVNTLQRLHITESATGFTLTANDVEQYNGTREFPSNAGLLRLFAQYNAEVGELVYAKLKQKQILGTMAGQTLLLVPCYRKSDNEIGIYDAINNVFYPNSGTGTFLKGADLYSTP